MVVQEELYRGRKEDTGNISHQSGNKYPALGNSRWNSISPVPGMSFASYWVHQWWKKTAFIPRISCLSRKVRRNTEEPENNEIFCVKLSGAEISLECQGGRSAVSGLEECTYSCKWEGHSHMKDFVTSKNPDPIHLWGAQWWESVSTFGIGSMWSALFVTRSKTCLKQLCLFTSFGSFL